MYWKAGRLSEKSVAISLLSRVGHGACRNLVEPRSGHQTLGPIGGYALFQFLGWNLVCGGERKGRYNRTRFIVRRSVHQAEYVEKWRMSIESNSALTATALRGWDKTNNRWMYTWVASNGLYQVWEGRKNKGHWYIYHRFNIEGDQYLSRQGWIPESPGRVLRVSEKSYDDGATWQVRFKQILVRKER